MPKKLKPGLKKYNQCAKIKKASAISKIVSMISFDYPKEEIRDYIIKEFDVKESTFNVYYKEAVKRMQRYRDNTIKERVEKNVEKLQGLINELYDTGDIKKLLSAIDMLNKILGAYESKISVNVENDEPFKITLDE